MTPACAGCGAALDEYPIRRTCRACGLRVGDLPANVARLRVEEQQHRQRQKTQPLRRAVRPLLLLSVVAVVLAVALSVATEASQQPDGQPALAVVGRTVQVVAQAAESQIARRSRTPGPGNPDSPQWKQAGPGQLAILVLVAGGLILFVRTRLR